MYSGSTEFNNLIEKSGGNALTTRFTFSDFSIEKFTKLEYYGGSNNSDDIAIGTTNMAYLDVSTITDKLITNQEFLFEVGMELSDGTIEYAPMGYFTVQSPDSDEDIVNFKAYDRMQKFEVPYTSSLAYPTDSSQILNELCTTCGVELATPIASPITITDKLEGYTCREVLGYIAGIHGFFACFDRYGKLNLRWYSETPIEKQIGLIWALTKSQSDYKVEKITVAKDTENTYTSGTGISGINHSNPYATQEIADSIYTSLGNFTYRPCEISMLDDIRLDPWDMLKVTYLDGSVLTIPVMSISHSFASGETKVKSVGKTDTENEYSYAGPVTQAMDRMSTELLVANRIIATKVDAEWVNAHTVTADKIEATNARVSTLEATSLTAETADLRYANVTLANIDTANIDVANIGLLFTKVGLIDRATIVDGHITGFLDAVEVNANNITAGTLIADRILLKGSESGLLYALNNLGELTSTEVDTLDGTILTQRTVTADKLIANSITANELDITNIFADSAVLSTLTSQQAFINAISTNSIVVGASNKANNALNTVNNLEIGGRNLWPNSTFDLGLSGYSTSLNGGNAEVVSGYSGHNGIKISRSDYEGILRCYITTKEPPHINKYDKGDVFTLSAWVYIVTELTSDKGNNIMVRGTAGDTPQITIPKTTVVGKWTRFTTSWEAISSGSYSGCYILLRANGSMIVSNIKLEKGNKATDWTPAPEDTEDSISKVNTKAQGIIDNIYTPNTTTIDGGKITTGSIDALKISIGLGGNIYPNYDTFSNITDNTLYYQKYKTATASVDLTNGLYDDKCLKLVSSGKDAYVYLGAKENGYGCVRVQPGKIYKVSCYVKSSSSSSAQLYVVGHTAKNTTNSQHVGTTATVGTSWTRIEYTYTASSTYPYISIRIDNDTNNSTIYVDGIQIEEVLSTSQKASPFKPCNSTVIDGDNILTGSIDANKINVDNLNALAAKIGDFYIDNRIYSQNIDHTPSVNGEVRYRGIFQPYSVGHGNTSNRPLIEIERQYYNNDTLTTTYPFWVGYDGGIHATFGEICKFTLGDTIYSQNTSTTPTIVGEFRYTGSLVPYSSGTGAISNRSFIEVKIETIVDGKLNTTYPFWVGYDGGLHATKATITGTISGGSIISKGSSSSPTKLGDWDIVSSSGGTDLYSYNSTTKRGTGISTSGTNAIGVGFTSTSNWMDAPFRVTHDGTCYAKRLICFPEDGATSDIGNFTITSDGDYIGTASSESRRLNIYPAGKTISGKGVCYITITDNAGSVIRYLNSSGWH